MKYLYYLCSVKIRWLFCFHIGCVFFVIISDLWDGIICENSAIFLLIKNMLKLKINLLYIILFTIFVTHKIKRHGKNFKYNLII